MARKKVRTEVTETLSLARDILSAELDKHEKENIWFAMGLIEETNRYLRGITSLNQLREAYQNTLDEWGV